MYAITVLFLLVAVATLGIGWFFQDGLTLIWVSIGASVAATIFLVVGVFRRRPLEAATAGAPFGPEEGTEAAQAATVTEPREARPRAPMPQRRPAKKSAAKTAPATKPAAKKSPAKKSPAKKPAAKKSPAKKPAAKKPPAKKPAAKKSGARKKTSARASSSRAQVVAIPERGTFHQAGCRFVKGRRDTERITAGTAKRRGYSACGVCKPAA